MAGRHVREEADGEGERLREHSEDLDRQHEAEPHGPGDAEPATAPRSGEGEFAPTAQMWVVADELMGKIEVQVTKLDELLATAIPAIDERRAR